jgi:hypothetical protein
MADEPPNPLDDIKDPSELTDADWAEINKLRAAYETGGQERYRPRSTNWPMIPFVLSPSSPLFSQKWSANPSKTRWPKRASRRSTFES